MPGQNFGVCPAQIEVGLSPLSVERQQGAGGAGVLRAPDSHCCFTGWTASDQAMAVEYGEDGLRLIGHGVAPHGPHIYPGKKRMQYRPGETFQRAD